MPHCSSDACGQNSDRCPTREACGLPERRTFEPEYTISGPHRARKERAAKRAREFLIALGVVAMGFLLARFVLRALFPGVFQ